MQARMIMTEDELGYLSHVLIVERGDPADADYQRATVDMPLHCGVRGDEVGLIWENGDQELLSVARRLVLWLSGHVRFTTDKEHIDELLQECVDMRRESA